MRIWSLQIVTDILQIEPTYATTKFMSAMVKHQWFRHKKWKRYLLPFKKFCSVVPLLLQNLSFHLQGLWSKVQATQNINCQQWWHFPGLRMWLKFIEEYKSKGVIDIEFLWNVHASLQLSKQDLNSSLLLAYYIQQFFLTLINPLAWILAIISPRNSTKVIKSTIVMA